MLCKGVEEVLGGVSNYLFCFNAGVVNVSKEWARSFKNFLHADQRYYITPYFDSQV